MTIKAVWRILWACSLLDEIAMGLRCRCIEVPDPRNVLTTCVYGSIDTFLDGGGRLQGFCFEIFALGRLDCRVVR